MSGFSDILLVFCRAQGISQGVALELKTLEFGTLNYYLQTQTQDSMQEVFLLFPWDFLPDLDWRTGFPENSKTLEEYMASARKVSDILMARNDASFIYCPAPFPNLSANMLVNKALEKQLCGLAATLPNVIFVSEQYFSLENYLSFGGPIGNKFADAVAQVLCNLLRIGPSQSAKVLVSDLDNVMWHGVIGEDGIDGIRFNSEASGYMHFIYQSFLQNLRRSGVLLAAVSRNDKELAQFPFTMADMVLKNEDFVHIIGSYEAKSSQIRQLSETLNLHPSSFVFVDDNPVEIEEVRLALPEVKSVLFPDRSDLLPDFLKKIGHHFHRTNITDEDARRTELYKSRLLSMPPSTAKGADITGFLRGLKMKLKIQERSENDSVRAIQLINKTTQFNMNGHALSEEEFATLISNGARMYTAALSDQHGDHGEILAMVVDPNNKVITHFVMSCRVFQRRVENAFIAWIGRRHNGVYLFDFHGTNRNKPFQEFIENELHSETNKVEMSLMGDKFGLDYELFEIDDDSEIQYGR